MKFSHFILTELMSIIQKATYNTHDFKIDAQEPLYRGFVQLERVQFRHRLFNQNNYSPLIQRELVLRKQAAGVIIYDDQQQTFALIEQFRIGAIHDLESPWQLEIIAGVLDGDESPETCIRRESVEESGCEIHQLEHLFTFYPSAGACNEIFHLYAAQANLPTEGGIFGMLDEGENIKLHILKYADLEVLFQSQRLRNAPLIMALQWLKQHVTTLHNV